MSQDRLFEIGLKECYEDNGYAYKEYVVALSTKHAETKLRRYLRRIPQVNVDEENQWLSYVQDLVVARAVELGAVIA